MIKERFKIHLSRALWIGELLILCSSFYAWTSTIEVFPWHEPLTMGAWFLNYYLIPVQVVMILICLISFRKPSFKNKIRVVPVINAGMLIISFASVLIDEQLFYLASFVMAVIEVILLGIWVSGFWEKRLKSA